MLPNKHDSFDTVGIETIVFFESYDLLYARFDKFELTEHELIWKIRQPISHGFLLAEQIKGRNQVRKMRVLMLYGVNCTIEIWKNMKPYLTDYEIDCVEYPHEVTERATAVDDITRWVYENYSVNWYDAVIGHSLGGIIALQLAADYKMNFEKIIFLDTNLKPAEAFYRNLMMPEHMEKNGDAVLKMFEAERPFYRKELFEAIQGYFDYTECLRNIQKKVYAIYGDRGVQDYPGRIRDLNLPDDIVHRLEFRFITDSCHMMMVENPQGLSEVLKDILSATPSLSVCNDSVSFSMDGLKSM